MKKILSTLTLIITLTMCLSADNTQHTKLIYANDASAYPTNKFTLLFPDGTQNQITIGKGKSADVTSIFSTFKLLVDSGPHSLKQSWKSALRKDPVDGYTNILHMGKTYTILSAPLKLDAKKDGLDGSDWLMAIES